MIQDKQQESAAGLNAERFGEGREDQLPVILLHGWANSIETVRPLAQQLSNYSVVHALDLPGHGKSPVPSEVWGMDEIAEAVTGYLDSQSIARAHFIGHSFGGKTAIKLAAVHPERVGKVVLIGASGIRPKPTFKKRMRALYLRLLRYLLRFKNTAWGERIYREWYIPRYASRDYLNAGAMTKIFVKTVNQELHRELGEIVNPALLLWGERDDESPPSVGLEMSQLMKNAQLVVLPNQDHFPFLGTSAPLVIKYIRDFLFR